MHHQIAIMKRLAFTRAIYNKSTSPIVTKCALEIISAHKIHCMSTYVLKHSRKLSTSSKGFGGCNGDPTDDSSNSSSNRYQMSGYQNLEDDQSVQSGQDAYKNSSSSSSSQSLGLYHTVPRSAALGSDNGNNSTGGALGQQLSGIDRLHHLYNQPEVDKYASRPSVRLTPASMLYTGGSSDGLHLLRSAQYLQKELPVRVAHRISGFRRLPFIIAINPILLSVQELYVRTFKLLIESAPIDDSSSEQQFCHFLRGILNDHKDVVTMLASGFKESRRYLKEGNFNDKFTDALDMREVRMFLDRMLTSRLGLRMLAEHHLGLHNSRENFVGIVQTDFSLNRLAHKWADWCRRLCEHTYGVSPKIEVNGHLDVIFPYIPMPLDYILPELLKNALRATVELHRQKYQKGRHQTIPKVVITIASNDTDFMIRISDRGGGVPSALYNKIFHYNFSTVSDANGTQLFDTIVEESNHGTGPMHGYGFGLPTCKAYAEYLGGSLTVENMYGIGCDVYLKLRHINTQQESFRI